MTRSQDIANKASGLLGFAGSTYFAWTIYKNDIPQNAATWGMTLLLDVLGVVLAYKAGNKRPLMQIGWVGAASCILMATLIGHGAWHWGMVESVCLLLCAIAVVLWLSLSARVAIFAFLAAMVVAAVPLLVDYWHRPQPSTTWIWWFTIFTCFLSIYGAREQRMEYTAVPWVAIAIDALFTFLCVR